MLFKQTVILLYLSSFIVAMGGTREVIPLWPGEVPGGTKPKAAPVNIGNAKGTISRVDEVTNPTLTVFKADIDQANGAAVIVFPGGGYRMLTLGREGFEVAEWLSDLGYTAFVLQYRVPHNREAALQDAQRAVRLVRSLQDRWSIDPGKIGLLGFSAGGSLSARLSTRYDEALYSPVDTQDAVSARPDFTALIYPAYLDEGPGATLSPELILDQSTPPMFLYVSADDRFCRSSLVMGRALLDNKTSFELHVMPEGGHGYGMRSGNPAAEAWPKLCEVWLSRTLEQ